MNDEVVAPTYAGYRIPAEIISHAVWLYFRIALSYRDVGELLAERGVVVTYETVRRWSRKFGQTYANALRRRRPRPGDKWLLGVKTSSGTVVAALGDGRVAASCARPRPLPGRR